MPSHDHSTNLPITLQSFPFHGDTISTARDERTGKVYCLPREICERMGMSWGSQHGKLTQSKLYRQHLIRTDIGTDGLGVREALFLDVDYLPAWLTSISPEKVSPGVREKLELYQEESAKALRDYWYTGTATRTSPLIEQRGFSSQEAIAIIQRASGFLDSIGMLEERDKLFFRDCIMNAVQRELGPTPEAAGQALLAGGGEPPFTVADRVLALAPHLSSKKRTSVAIQAGTLAAREYRQTMGMNPQTFSQYIDGACRPVKFYPASFVSTVDACVQIALSKKGLLVSGN